MPQDETISVRAFTILTVFFMIGTSILIAPAGLALDAKQDAWLASMIGVGINLSTVALYAGLGRLRKGESLVQMCRSALGKWAGALLGLAFAAFFYLLASLMVGDLGYFMTTQNLPETPIEILQLLFVGIVVYAVRLGKSAYSRAAEIFFPWLMLLFALLFISTIPKMDFHNFEPVLEYGLMPSIKGGVSLYGLQEMVVLTMLYPYIRKSGSRTRAYLGGTLVGGAVLVLTTVSSIGVLGYAVTSNQLFPAYTLAKNISIGHFLERIEAIMILIWVLSILIKIVLTFDAAVMGFAQAFGIKQQASFVIPLGLGLVVLAQMSYPNTVFIQDFLAKNWSPFASIFLIYLPLLLYGILWARSKAEAAGSG
ncbi:MULTISPECIES: endospore germination permease [unclassified Paenibacillus]|uniref:GerAB/ArcD/ProY family transporter n=1 Tax=unclassified Paenibacillus TaxID=185978 RepID=UPI000954E7A2|nr:MULTISPECIES: endospore germination permease [unclassified Paenibacillus]ASS66594.1 endospore germination permease [Paenibacillus sp. RUD330]SIQ01465.1 spore germination protein KB [Paenibacillus sp. RU4X]SIQ20713.1 spore germination protein KB [Paenibacillus sp. RU4T]